MNVFTDVTSGRTQTVDENGLYVKHKEEFADKIIEYSDSPSGKAYIGINKRPLMKAPGDRGYMGVLLQEEDSK